MEVVKGRDHTGGAMRMLKEVASSFPWVDLVLLSELRIRQSSAAGMNRTSPVN
jgi:hypothetical protein